MSLYWKKTAFEEEWRMANSQLEKLMVRFPEVELVGPRKGTHVPH